MTYLIDAWLDRPHPYLRILHRETGEVCAVLGEDALDELRDQGDLDLHGSRSWCATCFCSATRGHCGRWGNCIEGKTRCRLRLCSSGASHVRPTVLPQVHRIHR
jgi:hypothetical protein